MNNCLEFRIWDAALEKFVDGYGSDHGEYEELYSDPPGLFLGAARILARDPKRYKIERYIGLLDKRGKKICEGDVIQYNQNSSYDRINFIVKWSADRLGFIFQSRSGEELVDEPTPNGNRFKHLEIVGNIHILPCQPDHNAECLVCDDWITNNCEFVKILQDHKA